MDTDPKQAKDSRKEEPSISKDGIDTNPSCWKEVLTGGVKEGLKEGAKDAGKDAGKDVLAKFLPMLGTSWFFMKLPVMGWIHIIICFIIAPLISYSLIMGRSGSEGLSKLAAIASLWIVGWILNFVSDLVDVNRGLKDAYKEDGVQGVIGVIILVIIGGVIGYLYIRS